MNLIIIFLIAISLSMDAFSLSLAYGTFPLTKRDILALSIIVGVCHFFMPLLGRFVGYLIFQYIPLAPSVIVFVILTMIGIHMIKESYNEEQLVVKKKISELLIFGFAVSLDAFSVGISLQTITNHYLIGSLLFASASFFFTWLGLRLGNRMNQLIGNIATIIGGVFLVIIGFLYLF